MDSDMDMGRHGHGHRHMYVAGRHIYMVHGGVASQAGMSDKDAPLTRQSTRIAAARKTSSLLKGFRAIKPVGEKTAIDSDDS